MHQIRVFLFRAAYAISNIFSSKLTSLVDHNNFLLLSGLQLKRKAAQHVGCPKAEIVSFCLSVAALLEHRAHDSCDRSYRERSSLRFLGLNLEERLVAVHILPARPRQQRGELRVAAPPERDGQGHARGRLWTEGSQFRIHVCYRGSTLVRGCRI